MEDTVTLTTYDNILDLFEQLYLSIICTSFAIPVELIGMPKRRYMTVKALPEPLLLVPTHRCFVNTFVRVDPRELLCAARVGRIIHGDSNVVRVALRRLRVLTFES